jgi:hypothetical protein
MRQLLPRGEVAQSFRGTSSLATRYGGLVDVGAGPGCVTAPIASHFARAVTTEARAPFRARPCASKDDSFGSDRRSLEQEMVHSHFLRQRATTAA